MQPLCELFSNGTGTQTSQEDLSWPCRCPAWPTFALWREFGSQCLKNSLLCSYFPALLSICSHNHCYSIHAAKNVQLHYSDCLQLNRAEGQTYTHTHKLCRPLGNENTWNLTTNCLRMLCTLCKGFSSAVFCVILAEPHFLKAFIMQDFVTRNLCKDRELNPCLPNTDQYHNLWLILSPHLSSKGYCTKVHKNTLYPKVKSVGWKGWIYTSPCPGNLLCSLHGFANSTT